MKTNLTWPVADDGSRMWPRGFRTPHSALRIQSGFSLIEILVVVALLTVIILGLLLMFNQTHKAYTTGMTQVDVLEGGRTVTDMIARELSQMTPSYQIVDQSREWGLNFLAFLPLYTPLLQPLPGAGGVSRTNLLEDLFFLRRENQTWYGIGYFVRTNDLSGNLNFPQTVGTLYRSETKATVAQMRQDPGFFYGQYRNARNTESQANRILDGVVHFKVRAYSTNGNWISKNVQDDRRNSDIQFSTTVADEISPYKFYSNAVPAFVEFELGILERRILERAKAIPDAAVRREYLEKQASRVHLFRMRVPIRNVDPLAYQ